MNLDQKIQMAWNDLALAVHNHDLKRATTLVFILKNYILKFHREYPEQYTDEGGETMPLPIIEIE